MAQSILYYPTININNSEWLKSAIFYWDEVCSIVPYEGYTDISEDIEFLKGERVYRAIYPQDMLESEYAPEFINTVVGRMKPVFQSSNIRQERGVHIRREKVYDPSLYTLVHYKKFPSELFELLVKSGNISSDYEDGWVEMDTRFANVYMKTLAEYVALHDEKDVIISSDKISGIDAIYPRTWKSVNNIALELCLHQCLPTPADDVAFDDLLEFKRRRRDDLYELQRKIRELEFAISYSESRAEVKSRLIEFAGDWNHELNDADKLFRGDKINYVLRGMRTFISTSLEGRNLLQLAEELGVLTMCPSALGVSTGAFGVLAVGASNRNYKKKIKAEQKEKGFAYLIGANNERLLRNIEIVN